MGSDRDMDDAIDRAVRDIMDVETRAGFRGRVLDRLERPRTGLFVLPRLAAATVIAIALIAFLMMRPATGPVAPPAIATNTSPPAAPDNPALGSTTSSPAPTVAAAPREVPRSAPRRSRRPTRADIVEFPAPGVVSAATVASGVTTPGNAPDVVPLPLDRDAQPIAIQVIRIDPLAVERILVAPIPPPR